MERRREGGLARLAVVEVQPRQGIRRKGLGPAGGVRNLGELPLTSPPVPSFSRRPPPPPTVRSASIHPFMSSTPVALRPFPDLAVEIIRKILAQCDQRTLADACAASFTFLELASPLLYRDAVVTTDRLHLLLSQRVSSHSASGLALDQMPHLVAEADSLLVVGLARQMPPLDSLRLRPLLALDLIDVLTLRPGLVRRVGPLPAFADRLLHLQTPFPPTLDVAELQMLDSIRVDPFDIRFFNPRRVRFECLQLAAGRRWPLSIGRAKILPTDRGKTHLCDVFVKNGLPACPFFSQGVQAMFPSPGARVTVDLRAVTLVDRGHVGTAWATTVGDDGEPGVLMGTLEIWMGSEKEKVAMEKMIRRRGWQVPEGIVIVKEADA